MPVLEPKLILCPIDFSASSAAALRVAGGFATVFSAEILVLHAERLEAPAYFTASQVESLESHMRRSLKAARRLAEEFAKKHTPAGAPVSISVVEGEPVKTILHTVRQKRAGLIVMGTHGRTGLKLVRLGSVTDSVVRQSSVPAVTVGPQVKPTASLGKFRRLVCPVNFDGLARTALKHAAVVAEKTGAELQVLHVVEQGTETARDTEAAGRELCNWVDPELRQRCSLREAALGGNAADQIVAEAKRNQADLIVIGARPRSLLGAILFGSTTETLIRNAPCPVMLVIGH